MIRKGVFDKVYLHSRGIDMEVDDIVKQLSAADIEDAETFRKTKETAILVLMFIDMVHSTALREQMGEIQFEALRRSQKGELTALIERGNSGKVIKDLGDGLIGVFAMPDLAVKSALSIQEMLAAHPVLKVRIGVDMGQVTQELERGIVKDVFGRHVNRAARLEALSAGGHVLVSYPVWDSAKGWLKHLAQIRWKKHGSYWLKGITEPQVVYEPYNTEITKPLAAIAGEKVKAEDELAYCPLCGRDVKIKDTTTCPTCGMTDVCRPYCYDQAQQQCVECAAQMPPARTESRAAPPVLASAGQEAAGRPDFDVFLGYAPPDQTIVLRLSDYLIQEGLTVWIDEEQIEIGAQIEMKIRFGLQQSQFVVLCLSKHFKDSFWTQPEYMALLVRETQARNDYVLPVVISDCGKMDIPAFLYDKYCVDGRTTQGAERLVKKIRSAAQSALPQPAFAARPSVLPAELQAGLQELQRQFLTLLQATACHDEMVAQFDQASLRLLNLLEQFPAHFFEFHEIIAVYQDLAERMLRAATDPEFRRVLAFRAQKVEHCIEDLAGGFHCGESLLQKGVPAGRADSPYAFYVHEEVELDQGLKKLLSDNELDESEGLDWLFRAGFATAETRLAQIAQANLRERVFAVLWKRSPRIFLYYNAVFWDVVKYILSQNGITWKLRLHAMKMLLQRSLTAEQAAALLANFLPTEQPILSAYLMLHPKRECRELALQTLPGSERWDLLLCPHVPWSMITELVAQSCQDGSASYVKALFLLLQPRVLAVDSPLSIGSAYNILNLFYRHPVFLQETFFQALIELHRQVSSKALAHPLTQHLEQEFTGAFEAFCAQNVLKDADVAEMAHIPLPIQRKLAHDGYFPKYFICNTRDPIALETIPHVERRPDIVEFFRLRIINGRALDKLASNKLLMQEYRNRVTFCRNPKASAAILRNYVSTLTRVDLKEISRDRNVSLFARDLALKYLTRGNT